MSNCSCTGSKRVTPEESLKFVKNCFTAAGASDENAAAMADVILISDLKGHFGHGMNRLEMYINELLLGATDGSSKPVVLKETVSSAWVDGRNSLGAVIGNFCMDIAIAKAKKTGIAIVCAKRANHYGLAGYYAQRAIDQGMIGMSMSNTSPLMTPTRSKTAALGTNPLSFGAASANDKFLLDMATTTVALSKIEMLKKKKEKLQHGWAQDSDGQETLDADDALKAGCLYPLGGAESSGGYKGYGLGAMVDIFSGVLSGANYATHIKKWNLSGDNVEANLGCTFIAINPENFAPNFGERLEDFNNILRTQTEIDPKRPILVPGDESTKTILKTKIMGIEYTADLIETCADLAEKLKIEPLKYI